MKYPYLTVALLVFFGIIDIVILGNHYELTKSDWSGWVQAIGSIAALGVAVFVMSRQNRHAAKLLTETDKRALVRRGASVHALMERAVFHVGSCSDAFQKAINDGTNQSIFAFKAIASIKLAEAKRVLISVPGHELGSYAMTVSLQNIIECLADVELLIESGTPLEIFAGRGAFAAQLTKHLDQATIFSSEFKKGLEALSRS